MYRDASCKPIRRKLKSVVIRPSHVHQNVLMDNSGCTISDADLDDISSGLEQLQMVIIKKAAAISPWVHETTLGPQVETNYSTAERCVYLTNDFPSKKIEINAGKPGTTKSYPSETYNETHTFHQLPRRNDKLIFELEQERQRYAKKYINNRIYGTISSYKAAQDSGSSHQVVTDLRAVLDQKRAVKDAEEKAADEALSKQREMLAQRQRQQCEREEAALLAEKVKREQEDQRMLAEFLLHEKEFHQICQSLSESIKCCADKQALVASNTSSFSSIKSLSDWMAQLAAQILCARRLGVKMWKEMGRRYRTYRVKDGKKILLEVTKALAKTLKTVSVEHLSRPTIFHTAGDMNHVALQKVSAITRQCETYSKILQEEVKKINKNVLEREQQEQQEQKIVHQQREKAARELQAKEAAAAAVAAARADAVAASQADTFAAAATQRAADGTHQPHSLPPAEESNQQQHSLPPVEMKGLDELQPSSTQPATTQDTKKVHLGYLEGCVDVASFQTYKRLTASLAEFQSSFSQLSHDPQYKDFTFNCKKAVNIPVNAIGDQSGDHLLDKFHRLSTLLKGGTVHLSDVPFRATGHPQGVNFCMDLLASKLVDQGKTTVSSRAETAFPIAAVIVALWVEIPAFGQVIQAHFFKACPYLVPIFFPQVEGQSDEEYWKSRGYQFENGKPEKEASFVKKMGGIMQLYAAVIVSSVRRQQRAPHPLGLPEGWRWVSCMVNIAPQPAISASLLLTFLEVAGSAMFAAYQHQFQKVLHFICKDYLQKIKETDTPGAGGYVSRLESFLHAMLKSGGIPPPRGALPAHFW